MILGKYVSYLNQNENYSTWGKGQLISKADWRAIDSPKKRTDEFVLFAFLLFMANKSNSSVRFLGEFMARQSAFEINWPLALIQHIFYCVYTTYTKYILH